MSIVISMQKNKIVQSAMLSQKSSLMTHNADLRASKMFEIEKLDTVQSTESDHREWEMGKMG